MKKLIMLGILGITVSCSNQDSQGNVGTKEELIHEAIEKYIKEKVQYGSTFELVSYGKINNDTNFVNLKAYESLVFEEITLKDEVVNNDANVQLGLGKSTGKNYDSLLVDVKNRIAALPKGMVGYSEFCSFKLTDGNGITNDKTLYFRLDTNYSITRADADFFLNEYRQSKMNK